MIYMNKVVIKKCKEQANRW